MIFLNFYSKEQGNFVAAKVPKPLCRTSLNFQNAQAFWRLESSLNSNTTSPLSEKPLRFSA
jgi:hypothetical protein